MAGTYDYMCPFAALEDARTWWENSGYFDMERYDDFDEATMLDELWRTAENSEDLERIVNKYTDIEME